MVDPRSLIERLSGDIADALGDQLLGLYLHGSWVLGDFDARRSDLDLLAVLADDPSARTAEVLRSLHDRLAADHPEWTDRVEAEYVAATALARFRTDPRPMVRISPGEPLHVLPATRHYLLNWYAAREWGLTLRGPRPQDLIPAIPAADRVAVVREHASRWPEWVAEMTGPGGQAYAVLTLCRALHSVETGGQVSKRAAASWAADALPARADLVDWAARWWYEAGPDSAPDRAAQVTDFVTEVAARIAATPAPSTGPA